MPKASRRAARAAVRTWRRLGWGGLLITALFATSSAKLPAAEQAPRVYQLAGSAEHAAMGDGVCAASFSLNGVSMTQPQQAAVHARAAAIAASRADLASPFRDGAFDAYFASVGGRPTWVVEVNGLNYPWSAGGVLHTTTISLHHVVEFVDDVSLTAYESFGCP
ncbi:MAG: hypothetical protein ACYDAC_02150 [Candidatus Dormibacteria bacterium]